MIWAEKPLFSETSKIQGRPLPASPHLLDDDATGYHQGAKLLMTCLSTGFGRHQKNPWENPRVKRNTGLVEEKNPPKHQLGCQNFLNILFKKSVD